MSCSVHASIPAGQPVAVSVNGVVIARDAIQREMQHHPAEKPLTAWQRAARALVVRELLLQRARHLDIAPEPLEDADGRRETEEESLIRGLIEREVTTPEPDEPSCRRYYEQNLRSFRTPPIYEAAHILFAARRDDGEAFAQARNQVLATIEILNCSPDRFAELAQVHSACPSAAQGGNLGQVSPGQTTPEFEAALAAMPVGTISREPVVTRYGLHIVRLDRKIDGRQLPYELVAQPIADYLRESVTRRATAQYIARLASRATVTGVALTGADAHRVH